MSATPQTAAEDWRGRWDDFGTRQDRLAYLREYWPLLLADIEAEARAPFVAELREAVTILESRGASGPFIDEARALLEKASP